MLRKVLLFVLIILGPFSLLYFLNKSNHVFVPPPYIGGYEVAGEDTVFHRVPEFDFKNVLTGKSTDVSNKIVILFAVQNSCYDNSEIHDCGYYPFHVESILYDDILKNKKSYQDLIMISVVTDRSGNPEKPNEKIKNKFRSYNSDIWILAEGDIKPFFDFENNGHSYLLEENDQAYNGKSYLSTMLLIDKDRHIRGFFGGRLNAEVREFKDRLNVLKKYYKVRDEDGSR